jgi:hypothetical protein
MRRAMVLLLGLSICMLILTQCSKRRITIEGKVSSVGYTSLGKDRNTIEYHSIEINSNGNTYECKFTPADAESVLGKQLVEKLLVPDPDHETNQLILTDEPLQNKTIVATLTDVKPVGQNRFVSTLTTLSVKDQ